MRYGVISDIHSNLEALLAALEALDDVDEVLCLGDVVGYGANPIECCALVRERCSLVIRGNHDRAALDPSAAEDFNPYAARAIRWTSLKLQESQSTLAWLRDLHDELWRDTFMLSHGSPANRDAYVFAAYAAVAGIGAADRPVAFCGHTHVPVAYHVDMGSSRCEESELLDGRVLVLREDRRYLINPGSVGQPRDDDPRAAFGVFDDGAHLFEFRRVAYDVAAAQRKIREARLPSVLADRLSVGT
jgi:diadenosine tetraphosphatase ApaH/serine/threonine PP2A family protein phosphatase